MKSFKTKLAASGIALALCFTLMSFTSAPQVQDNISSEEIALAKNGEYISAGDELINGVWYSVKQCVAGTRVKCVIGSKIYKRKRMISVEEELPVMMDN
ncbi:MAG: hypothetical protein AAFV95_17510 [Bacteroidota bacterium]